MKYYQTDKLPKTGRSLLTAKEKVTPPSVHQAVLVVTLMIEHQISIEEIRTLFDQVVPLLNEVDDRIRGHQGKED